MERVFSPIQKLDDVLLTLVSSDILYVFHNSTQLHEHLLKRHGDNIKKITELELISILNKLEKDGYVETSIYINPVFPEAAKTILYKITFEGEYFTLYQNGYEGLDYQKNVENIRLEKVEAFQSKLALFVAIGTVGLLIWEVIKYFVFEHHWYFHHF